MNLLRLLASPGGDFSQLIEGGILVILRLVNPYERLISSPGPLNYPPSALLFFLPFGYLQLFFDQTLAWYVWVFASLAALFISLRLLLKMIGVGKLRWLVVAILLFWFLFFPTKFTLGMGQVNLFILLFIVLGIFQSRQKKYVSATFFLALATAVKLSPLVLALYFLLRWDKKSLVWYFSWLAVFFLLPFLFVSFDWQKLYYTHVFFNAFTVAGKEVYYNQSLLAFLARSLSNVTVIKLTSYSLSVVLVILTSIRARKISDSRLWSALVSQVLLINPLAWQHHFVLAIIPIILLTKEYWGKLSPMLLLAMAYLLTAANIINPGIFPREFNFLRSHQFFGAVLLWILAVFGKSSGKVLAFLWVSGLTVFYILTLFCRAKICF